MIPFWQPEVGEDEERRVLEVLRSGYLNEGDVVEEFEQRLAEFLGVRYAVATTSGTAALFLALKSLGIGPGDEVIVPAVTFAATANAVWLTGAKPVLVDVDPRTFTIDPEAVLKAINPRTAAIVPVHVSGRGADMQAILKIAAEHALWVVEDAAEALGSKQDTHFLGTIGNAGCFSFSPNKTITTGQGGLVVTNNDSRYHRLRELKDQGRLRRGTGGDDLHASVGYNFKMTNLQAAVGLAQLDRVPARIERQRRIWSAYARELGGGVIFPFPLRDEEVPQWTDALCDRRDELCDFLDARGVQCRKYWRPLHTQPPYFKNKDWFPVANSSWTALWLPSAFTLTDADVERICGLIREFYAA